MPVLSSRLRSRLRIVSFVVIPCLMVQKIIRSVSIEYNELFNKRFTIPARPITFKPLPKNFVPRVYRSKDKWGVAPIVVKEYKLLFFHQGKVACTEFKKLLRRMMHLDDWRKGSDKGNIPHNPSYNGLKYLYHYPLKTALEMLTDPEWTRAIFVRDPKERFFSAYLDKAKKKDGIYVTHHCCNNLVNNKQSCGKRAARSLLYFTKLAKDHCSWDHHWQPQYRRIDKELWSYVNFVGQFDSLAEDTRRMLERLGHGAWEKFGASGWGEFHNETAFVGSNTATHRTSARAKLSQYINETIVDKMLDEFYSQDYMHAPFNFTWYSLADPLTMASVKLVST
ncbi:hypothetical protein ACHAW5_010710 [Stephanodiscus triporus]|uniref:Carbohydrate sulfotransferase n=1 Tax=Stephanodiscus triporus TaxID=2934178 RepID=A0ABD3MHM1_9STRA